MELICTICYEPFRYAPTSATDCGHLYHETCITRWLETHASCPECRNANPRPLRTVHFDFVGPVEEEEEEQHFDDSEQDVLPPGNALVRAKFDFLLERCIKLRTTLNAIEKRKAKEQRKRETNQLKETIIGKRKAPHDAGEGGSDRKRMPADAQGGRYAKDTLVTEQEHGDDSSEGESIPNSQI